MPIDPNVFDKLKTFEDYRKADDEFQQKKQLVNAQLITAQAALAKAGEVDADKIGEQAFLKAAQGLPLSATEQAGLQYLDAKSPTAAFNPVTGVMEEKPSLLERAGLSVPSMQPQGAHSRRPAMSTPDANASILDIFGQGQPQDSGANQFDIDYQNQLRANAGNPRAQQELTNAYNKAKVLPTEDQSKAAGYADRMLESSPIIDQKQAAGTSATQRALGAIPLIGNYATSDDYQSFNQAQRDFINAQLRRESGAAISEGEFANAKQQYFPQPGDSEQVLTQKAANRESAMGAMKRSAGASYKPSKVTPVEMYRQSEADFNAAKIATPEEIAAYKQQRGIK